MFLSPFDFENRFLHNYQTTPFELLPLRPFEHVHSDDTEFGEPWRILEGIMRGCRAHGVFIRLWHLDAFLLTQCDHFTSASYSPMFIVGIGTPFYASAALNRM